MRIARSKAFIFFIVAFVLLLSTALVGVSYAFWGGTTTPSVTIENNTIGKFYINYPSTSQASTVLDDNTYYLAVPTVDSNGKTLYTDYYKMMTTLDMGGNDQHEVSVKLRKGNKVSITKGSAVQTVTTSNTGSYTKIKFSGNTGEIPEDGIFSFYYSGSTVYIAHKSLNAYDAYTSPMTLSFGDNKKIKLHIKKPTVAGYSTLYMYSYFEKKEGSTTYNHWFPDSNVANYPGRALSSSFTSLEFKSGNTWYSLDNDKPYLFTIFNFGKNGAVDNPKTDSICYNKNIDSTEYEYYLELGYDSENKKITWGIDRTISPIKATVDRSDDMVVRKVNTSTGTTETTYKNYVCVSREGGTDTSLAYVNFLVTPRGSTTAADLAKVNVSSFKVTRTATDAEGNPKTAKTDEFVYNVPTTLAAVSGEEKSSGGRNYVVGGTYIMLFFGPAAEQYYALDVEITTVIDAATAAGLENVDFTLTAVAANADWRNQYKPGYGAANGYYLGGNFNGVDLWDPREATHFKNVTESGSIPLSYNDFGGATYNAPTNIDITLEIDLHSAGDRFKVYRLGASGERTGVPTIYLIPREIISNVDPGTGNKTLYDNDLNIIVPIPGKYELHFTGEVVYKGSDVGDSTQYYGYNRDYSITGTDPEFLTKGEYYTYKNGTMPQITDALNKTGDQFIGVGNWNGFVDKLYVRYIGDKDTVSINYNANGGTFAAGEGVSEDGTVLTTENAWAQVPTALDASKYPTIEDPDYGTRTVVGWYTDADCTAGNEYKFDTQLLNEITLYAKWTDVYNVTLDANGGYFGGSFDASGNPLDANGNAMNLNSDGTDRDGATALERTKTVTVADGAAIGSTTEFTLNKFVQDITLTGWKNGDAAFSLDTAIGSDMTLTATWSKYLVTFNPKNGGFAFGNLSPKWASASAGGKIAVPETDPTRDGLYFAGWDKNGTEITDDFNRRNMCTDPWDFGADTVSGDTMLYAKWVGNGATYAEVDGTNRLLTYTGNLSGISSFTFTEGDYKQEYDIAVKLYAGDKVSLFNGNVLTLEAVTLGDGITLAENALTVASEGNYLFSFRLVKDESKVAVSAAKCTAAPDYLYGDMTFKGKWYADNARTTEFDNTYGVLGKVLYPDLAVARTVRFDAHLPWGVDAATNLTGMPDAVTVEDNTAVSKPETDPAIPNIADGKYYKFDAWCMKVGTDTYEPYDFTQPVVSDITLYATWEVRPIVKFNARVPDGRISAESIKNMPDPLETVVDNGTVIAEPTDKPTLAGYTFRCWATDGFGHEADFTQPLTDNTNFYTFWDKVNYTVKFNSCGGSAVADQTEIQVYGKKATAPEVTREGYTLDGWYTAASGGDAWSFDADITVAQIEQLDPSASGVITLYAHWTANEYTVTFDVTANGGSGSNATETVTYADTVKLKADGTIITTPAHTDPNYTFVGWYTTAASDDGVKVTEETDVKQYLNHTDKTLTLYARWVQGITYSVTYNANLPEGDANLAKVTLPTDITDIVSGGSATVADPTVASGADIVFAGWYETADFSGERVSGTISNINADIELFAKWTVTVTFSLGEATTGTPPATQTVVYGEKATTVDAPEWTGHNFLGWFESDMSTGFMWDDPVKKNYDLIAKWEAKTYTVKYDANGATATIADGSVKFGETIATAPAPTRTNYRLDGWWSAKTGGTRWIFGNEEGAATTLTADNLATFVSGDTITLYAHWIRIYIVHVDANGGKLASGTLSSYSVEEGNVFNLPTKPTKDRHSFLGWFDSASNGTKYNGNITVNSDKWLYAHWASNYYIVGMINGTENWNNLSYNLIEETDKASYKDLFSYDLKVTATTYIKLRKHTDSGWDTNWASASTNSGSGYCGNLEVDPGASTVNSVSWNNGNIQLATGKTYRIYLKIHNDSESNVSFIVYPLDTSNTKILKSNSTQVKLLFGPGFSGIQYLWMWSDDANSGDVWSQGWNNQPSCSSETVNVGTYNVTKINHIMALNSSKGTIKQFDGLSFEAGGVYYLNNNGVIWRIL